MEELRWRRRRRTREGGERWRSFWFSNNPRDENDDDEDVDYYDHNDNNPPHLSLHFLMEPPLLVSCTSSHSNQPEINENSFAISAWGGLFWSTDEIIPSLTAMNYKVGSRYIDCLQANDNYYFRFGVAGKDQIQSQSPLIFPRPSSYFVQWMAKSVVNAFPNEAWLPKWRTCKLFDSRPREEIKWPAASSSKNGLMNSNLNIKPF